MSIQNNTSNDDSHINENVTLVQTQEDKSNLANIDQSSSTTSDLDGKDVGEKPETDQSALQNDQIKEHQDAPTSGVAPNPPKVSVLKASLDRVFNNGGIRLGVVGACLFGVISIYAGYSIFFSNEETDEVQSGEFVVPKTNTKASATVNAEQAEYIKNQQEMAASEAAKNNGSYIAGFVDEQAQTDMDYYGETTQPGANEQQELGRTQFIDSQGRVYSLEQAAALSAEGKQIPGVTVGEGSVNDPNLGARTSNSQNKTNASPNAMNVSSKPAIESYVVQPYSSKRTGLSESASKQVESLNQSAQQTDQWARDYLLVRQKKAQLIDANTQLAFEEQLTPLMAATKTQKDDKTGGRYSRNHYSTPLNTTNSGNTTSKPITSAPIPEQEKKVLARAGQTYRAILTSTVNTDEGNEVIAKIQSGPFKGDTLIGTVKASEKNMQFVFTKVLRKNKPELALNAVARQIGTNSMGMADEVQNHTLQRYTALAVSSALSGVGAAYEQTSGADAVVDNGVVVTNSTDPSGKRILGNAVGELGQQISSDIKNVSKRKPTYIAMNGKVFNLFLNQDVVETPSSTSAK